MPVARAAPRQRSRGPNADASLGRTPWGTRSPLKREESRAVAPTGLFGELAAGAPCSVVGPRQERAEAEPPAPAARGPRVLEQVEPLPRPRLVATAFVVVAGEERGVVEVAPPEQRAEPRPRGRAWGRGGAEGRAPGAAVVVAHAQPQPQPRPGVAPAPERDRRVVGPLGVLEAPEERVGDGAGHGQRTRRGRAPRAQRPAAPAGPEGPGAPPAPRAAAPRPPVPLRHARRRRARAARSWAGARRARDG